ncbi:Ig-like domain-containing protein [Gammaproteobacteria bacterium]|nr:Ig-like domain-containing protein [Gammaproteobacteria bacterium]MDA9932093.1 Ig-like domain-containing protein [Gammaproteobacteria bacterium]
MKLGLKNTFLFLSTFIIVSCGGGGGGGGSSPTPALLFPTITFSTSSTSVLIDESTTLTWSSSNSTSCSASWTSQTSTSGTETINISSAGDNTFSISCIGEGGSSNKSLTVEGYRNTTGVIVDGYVTGANVFIDEDENWTLDASESSTTSDNEGKFTIKYTNGYLVSFGGIDLDSQTALDNLLLTHKLTGHTDFKVVTPLTSVAAFMNDASNTNAALGIDSDINIATFDPVANKGDGGVNDFLYEKGNQLTVLAYALQNITNDLKTTTDSTQDYFKAISEEIEAEYTETSSKVDIETEAFIIKALDNIIAAKALTISDEAMTNASKALSGVMPVIEVKSRNDLTTSVVRFAISTLQTDIKNIANGSASAETIASYKNDVLNYIAKDQDIDSNEITPDINAIADSVSTNEDTNISINVLANDSFISSSPYVLSALNGSHGLVEVSDNNIIYSPDSDFNGSDSFSYTITQGSKTSNGAVSVTVIATNDVPSINAASIYKVDENQTSVATIAITDVDGDELSLTMSGADADSFNLSSANILTFKTAPDFETKDSYSIKLTLTDGIETVEKTITINITDVNESVGYKVLSSIDVIETKE